MYGDKNIQKKREELIQVKQALTTIILVTTEPLIKSTVDIVLQKTEEQLSVLDELETLKRKANKLGISLDIN